MKSALVVLLPCLLATSLPLFARAQLLETITGAVVDQIIETIIDVAGVPLSGSCPEIDNLSDECKNQIIGGFVSSSLEICTEECYGPVLAAYESCAESEALGANFFVYLLRAGESKFTTLKLHDSTCFSLFFPLPPPPPALT